MGHKSNYLVKAMEEFKSLSSTPKVEWEADFFYKRSQELLDEAEVLHYRSARLLLETAKLNKEIAQMIESNN